MNSSHSKTQKQLKHASSHHREENIEMCQTLLAKELKQLQSLSQNIRASSHQTDPNNVLYSLFPLTCKSCGRIYQHHQEFSAETSSVECKKDSKFQQKNTALQDTISHTDVRICTCGTKISLWDSAKDRRDGSYLAFLKRILYQNCLQKLRETHPHNNKRELQELLRVFFRSE